MKYLSILLLAFVTVASSCNKKKNEHYTIKGDYMIMGQTGGYTMPDAITSYYLISNGELRQDKAVRVYGAPTDINKFNFNTVLPAAAYEQAKDLPGSIPAELLSRNNQHIGESLPDAGYTDVRVMVNGVAYHWYFDALQTASSTEVQDFVKAVTAVFR